jgi:hypothetical protein
VSFVTKLFGVTGGRFQLIENSIVVGRRVNISQRRPISNRPPQWPYLTILMRLCRFFYEISELDSFGLRVSRLNNENFLASEDELIGFFV